MSLKDVIGQDRMIQMLQLSLLEGNVFHAYILEGAEGIGKKFTAFNFTKAILCHESEACGGCSSCKKMDNGNHPDYYFVEPDGNSIKDSQIEEVQEIMAKKPYESKNTVIIINHAETMTVRAQNRFLKTLEEPRGDSIVILLTANANSLLPTITSRCMVMKLKPVQRDVICHYLIEKYKIEKSYAAILAAFAYGNIGRAVQLHQSELFKENRIKCIEIARQLAFIQEKDFYNIVQAMEALKEIFSELLDMIEFWFRDIILISVNGNRNLVMNEDYMDILLPEAKKLGYDKAAKIIYIIEDAKKDLKMHLNYNLVIKNMLLKIQEV